MKRLAGFDLLPAEKRLVAWLQAGNRKVFVLGQSVPDGPSDAVTLRATFIRYLALGGCEDCRLPETGLRVRGAFIDGDEKNSEHTKGLDLEGATLPHDLALLFCHCPDPIILRSAKVKNLFLNGSVVKAAISADRLQAEGSVSLNNATIAGEVRLPGARLGGSLDCNDAQLQDKRMALLCENMQAKGYVSLRGATIAGAVGLLGARLGRDLYCDSAELQAKGIALSCDGMQSASNVTLSNATIAGEVRLVGARLGGYLDCVGADMRAKGVALNCDGVKVSGTFFWREGAKASGSIV